MNGYLIQLIGNAGRDNIALYWTPTPILEELKELYEKYNEEQVEYEFETYWNDGHPEVQIERVFVDEIYI